VKTYTKKRKLTQTKSVYVSEWYKTAKTNLTLNQCLIWTQTYIKN